MRKSRTGRRAAPANRGGARVVAGLTLALSALLVQGCIAAAAAVPVAAAATASEKGFAFWESGKLRYVDEASFDEMSAAVDAVNARLALTERRKRDVSGKDGRVTERRWELRSDRENLLKVAIRPITARMTGATIESGLFGNRAAARLYADRLRAELEALQQPAG